MSEYQSETSSDQHVPCTCPHCGQVECCCSMSEKSLRLVKCAKHDLLKDKMKKLLEAKIGKRLDKVAEVAVDAILLKMDHKMAQKDMYEKLEDDLIAAWKV